MCVRYTRYTLSSPRLTLSFLLRRLLLLLLRLLMNVAHSAREHGLLPSAGHN